MHPKQDPMTGFKTLELAFSQGFRMRRVPFTENIHYHKDMDGTRHTYAKLDGLKVQQAVTITDNGIHEELGLPCFCLFYGTLESLRGKGLSKKYVTEVLSLFDKSLPKKMKPYCLDIFVDKANASSIGLAKSLFGEPSDEGVDTLTGEEIFTWLVKR